MKQLNRVLSWLTNYEPVLFTALVGFAVTVLGVSISDAQINATQVLIGAVITAVTALVARQQVIPAAKAGNKVSSESTEAGE